MCSAGLIPGDVIPDGRWHRCPTEAHPKKRNGSWKLALDGLIGWCQDFAVHTEPLTWRPDKDNLAQVDHSAIARRREIGRRTLIRATSAARAFYTSCAWLRGGHPYLSAHGLDMTGCHGLKIDLDGWLVVPVRLGRSLVSVQRISPEGEKLFWPGASVKGASYTIERTNASISVLCEGLATGLAIFAAAPLVRVIAAFNAGNLARVQMPPGMTVVAADNDHETATRIGSNPGLDAAGVAAAVLGCGVAVPTGIEGTDFCDWRQEMVARRLASRVKERESDIRLAVDAEIAEMMMRNAKFRV